MQVWTRGGVDWSSLVLIKPQLAYTYTPLFPSSEPESLIPLMRGSAHVVLVGDHFQLPPVVVSSLAAEGGLSLSLFERLMRQGLPSAMLEVGPKYCLLWSG